MLYREGIGPEPEYRGDLEDSDGGALWLSIVIGAVGGYATKCYATHLGAENWLALTTGVIGFFAAAFLAAFLLLYAMEDDPDHMPWPRI